MRQKAQQHAGVSTVLGLALIAVTLYSAWAASLLHARQAAAQPGMIASLDK